MKKSRILFWLNISAFTLFSFLLSTGILLYYRLPSGSGRWNSVWRLSRREWGEVHFWMAMVFVVIIVAHLALHKNWIYSVLKGKSTQEQHQRLCVSAIVLTVIIGVAVAPLVWG